MPAIGSTLIHIQIALFPPVLIICSSSILHLIPHSQLVILPLVRIDQTNKPMKAGICDIPAEAWPRSGDYEHKKARREILPLPKYKMPKSLSLCS